MLQSFTRALKLGDLRQRILYTLWMMVVFRIGAHIPVPGVNADAIRQLFEEGTLFGLLDLFAGGALSTFSIFAMSIAPYINASIIMQLLTVVVPKFEEWSREGEEGRRKLGQFTRYGTVVLALLQGLGIAYFLSQRGALDPGGALSVITVAITLAAGTAFLMWLGEQITQYGIGNGISLIIFAGIVSRLPFGLLRLVELFQVGAINIFNIIVLVVLGGIVIVAVVYIQEGQRRIPVHYSKRVVGRRIYGGQTTHIPMRINMAGVIPVIFAASLLALPPTIAAFIPAGWAQSLASRFSFASPLYTLVYALLIIFFTYFYTAIQFNPADVSDNLRKHGGYIPGIRPGRPTTEYLERVLVRITLAGAIFLAAISVLPVFFSELTNIPNLYFGGTALLIVVGVALDTMKQIESHLLMRQYEGFIRR